MLKFLKHFFKILHTCLMWRVTCGFLFSAQAREQLEKHKKEKKERERLGNNNSGEDFSELF